tara:strand:+ start:118 stop:564 length:447 start_codon:yes stop_codon:yes gene_type:complete
MPLKTYNFNQVHVTFGGVLLEGYGSNGGISIEFNEDVWECVVGADGEESRARKNDNGAECTITLMQTSASNDVLQGFLETDIASGRGVYPMTITDFSGRSLYITTAAYIKSRPSGTFNSGVEEREWVFRMLDVIDYCGGHSDSSLLPL